MNPKLMPKLLLLACSTAALLGAAACSDEGGDDSDADSLGLADLGRDFLLDPIVSDGAVLPGLPEPPIRIILKIHLEDLVTDCGTTTNTEEASPGGQSAACEAQFMENFEFVDRLVDLMEERGITLSIHGNGDWWQQVINRGLQDEVTDWVERGHEIGAHMHTVYETPLAQHDDRATADWCDDAAGSGVWAATEVVTEDGQNIDESLEQRCELWSDHDRLLNQLLPDVAITQATPYRNADPEVPAMMEAFGYSVLGGGERHEIFQEYFGHHPFNAWRIGSTDLEENTESSVVIVHTHAQLDTATVHGGCGGVFEDRSLGSMQVRFLEIYLNRLYAERTGDPTRRIWSFGFVVHDNQDHAWMTEAGQLAPDGALAQWLSWLEENWIDRDSLAGDPIAAWSSFQDVADATNDWYDDRPGQSYFTASAPDDSCQPAESAHATASELRVAACRSHYPYEYWGMGQALAATIEQAVQYVAPERQFSARGVVCHELAFGPRAPRTDAQHCGSPYPDTIVAGSENPRWLCWKESEGDTTIDLTSLDQGSDFVSIDPRSGVATAVADATSLTVGADPVILQLAAAPLYPWQSR